MTKPNEPFDLQEYLTKGVEDIVRDAVRATLKNPRESAFMLKFAAASKAASRRRRELEDNGEHVPSFLIASITSKCNLHCAGCYSRCNHATVDAEPVSQLTSEEWLRIFDEADELGVSFILLAGGEPMLRRDIIEAAGKKPTIKRAPVWLFDVLAIVNKLKKNGKEAIIRFSKWTLTEEMVGDTVYGDMSFKEYIKESFK